MALSRHFKKQYAIKKRRKDSKIKKHENCIIEAIEYYPPIKNIFNEETEINEDLFINSHGYYIDSNMLCKLILKRQIMSSNEILAF
ncbi:hypothetical protein ALNOE001_22040 [Candidatus Methanobinarius endosymbioticus]|uniref:Uncharacterized protein n=1 Tax=Candidatus Methanobinarius endosymbioticus TaxID=2006182 RepID=A0A366M8C0_9EURY|nr:hypothetical protein ALNOE001_22040 [Candidatus Methanobinarius endosymbioticus]